MNRITQLFGIQYPVIQAGMIWCSGWRLASAVSQAGGLGLLGAGSMSPELLRDQVRKCKQATSKPFGVNIPLLYKGNPEKFDILEEQGVPVIFTSAGNPATWTQKLKDRGFTVVHVVPNVKFARKCEDAGVDAVVAEGVEAGGHNGREETTTMVLIPMVREAVSIPLIAAGGIGSGRGMLAAFALGAEGVQIGSRFVASEESSAHPDFKQKVLDAAEGSTAIAMKKLVPVRLLDNPFARDVIRLEASGASPEAIAELLGKGRARLGMLEGNMEEGELEIGQVSGGIREIKPAGEILKEIIEEFNQQREALENIQL